MSYLLGVIEKSRLTRKMKREIAFMLLDETEKDLDILAIHVKSGKESFETLALSALSSKRLIISRPKDERPLTYEEALIKKAYQEE